MIYGPGMLDAGMTLNYSQLVVDNEMIKMIKHAVQGIPVNDYTIAADVIREVGPEVITSWNSIPWKISILNLTPRSLTVRQEKTRVPKVRKV